MTLFVETDGVNDTEQDGDITSSPFSDRVDSGLALDSFEDIIAIVDVSINTGSVIDDASQSQTSCSPVLDLNENREEVDKQSDVCHKNNDNKKKKPVKGDDVREGPGKQLHI